MLGFRLTCLRTLGFRLTGLRTLGIRLTGLRTLGFRLTGGRQALGLRLADLPDLRAQFRSAEQARPQVRGS